MRRLGVMGGTFDPIHIGHLLLAQFVQEKLLLDAVLFIPAADPPHKEDRSDMAPAADRLAMVELAIEGFPCFRSSRIELDRPGKSYTYDTLEQLRADCPRSELFLILGSDNSAQMATWYNPAGILELCTVVAGSRSSATAQVDPALGRRMVSIDTPVIDLSSTQIRRRRALGLSVRAMVPDKVEGYIEEKGLYLER